MKFEITLEKIKDAVSRIQKVSSKNISLPILENVLLEVKNNSLSLRSTNLHIGVEIDTPAKTEKEGVVCVKLDIFAQIINSLTETNKVSFELIDSVLHIQTENSQMSIKTFASNDFPTLPKITDGVEISVSVDVFIEGVRSVAYAASLSDIKPEISSVYIYSENNEIVFVSTDSFRLAEKRIVTEQTVDIQGVIIPIKNIQDCLKIIGGLSGDMSCVIGKNQLSLTTQNVYFTSRVVDGNYPDYQQLIPKESKTEVVVLKDELLQSLRLVNVFSDNFNQILFKTNNQKGIVEIYSRNTDIGENNTFVDAAITGDDIEMHLNHKYLSDVFSSIVADSISFSFTEKNRACVVRGIGNPGFVYLIMPMNR